MLTGGKIRAHSKHSTRSIKVQNILRSKRKSNLQSLQGVVVVCAVRSRGGTRRGHHRRGRVQGPRSRSWSPPKYVSQYYATDTPTHFIFCCFYFQLKLAPPQGDGGMGLPNGQTLDPKLITGPTQGDHTPLTSGSDPGSTPGTTVDSSKSKPSHLQSETPSQSSSQGPVVFR